ncbi:MAG TPA: hypothetical protein VM778_07830, partial [Gemmatimonadota bacterium]|nr:hypothetical protein [Gemmatimonadota bacterium]
RPPVTVKCAGRGQNRRLVLPVQIAALDDHTDREGYQHADPEGMLVALQSRRELREVAGIQREP